MVRVMYIHVPSAWNLFLGVGVGCLGSIMFLIKRNAKSKRYVIGSCS